MEPMAPLLQRLVRRRRRRAYRILPRRVANSPVGDSVIRAAATRPTHTRLSEDLFGLVLSTALFRRQPREPAVQHGRRRQGLSRREWALSRLVQAGQSDLGRWLSPHGAHAQRLSLFNVDSTSEFFEALLTPLAVPLLAQFVIGLWRGGTPIGICVEEFFRVQVRRDNLQPCLPASRPRLRIFHFATGGTKAQPAPSCRPACLSWIRV